MNSLKMEISKKIQSISNDIYFWSTGEEKYLNVVSPPYNSSYILFKTLLYFISQKKSILYITNENIKENDVLIALKKYITYSECPFRDKDEKMNLSNFHIYRVEKLNKVRNKYDLIVFNGIRSFIDVNNENIVLNLLNLLKKRGKIISYNFEKMFKHSREFIFPIKDNGNILVEPMFIRTKINLQNDIPQIAYEHISWSLDFNKRVIIYVPEKNSVQNVKNYLKSYFKEKCKVLSCSNNIANKTRLEKLEKVVLVTHRFKEDSFNMDNINIMVLNANSRNFNYKDIVYMCGRVSNEWKGNQGEVILLARWDNEEIDEAKSIIRNLNMSAWDMKLLQI